jgi:putative ABC transport system ATP-binding protein
MQLFNGFDLTVNNGEFVSVVGSNGSGKTTLLNIICGAIGIDSGSLELNGVPYHNEPEFKRYRALGRVYQDPSLGTCPSMTILENMSLADNKNKLFDLSWGTDRRRISFYKEQLEQLGLGLEDKLDIKVGLLSGGQRQALALLMSTLTPIDILLLDEHTAALDPKTAETIMALTDKIVKEKHLTTIMVTHNLMHAIRYGNRLIMMHEGTSVMDLDENKKNNTSIDDILNKFNTISLERGN